MLKIETKEAILKLQKFYPEKRSALLPALHLAQSDVGYLPSEVQQEVANLFEIELNEVNAIVTFYDMFFEKPIGKHVIHVCKNVSCMLNGGDELLSNICLKLGVKPKGTSSDGEFTVIPSECLAACDLAPMMLVDEKVIGPVKVSDINQILENAKNSPGHPSPITVDEVNNA